ncbi:MAG: hypothetical protein ACOVNM_06090 [Flavobacterium sp.]|nr:MAG: hypothetical protein DCF13_11820 [Flavobacteriaceae bacterium]
MFLSSKRLEERAEGLDTLKKIYKEKDKSLIIHYSCESFVTNHGKTPRVTSICIRFFESAQTKSFSIHLQAQFENMDFNDLDNDDYDKLERKILKEFYEFAESHKKYNWIHWNMRNSNFGFEAISNRYKILGGKPFTIDEDRRYDFPRILSKIYTHKYEDDYPDGRLLNLANRNSIDTRDALKGKEEALAFDNKKYLELHKSTLRKLDIVDYIIDRTYKNELKVIAKSKDIYGYTIPGIIEITKGNWILLAIWTILIYIIGAASEPLWQRLFGTAS